MPKAKLTQPLLVVTSTLRSCYGEKKKKKKKTEIYILQPNTFFSLGVAI